MKSSLDHISVCVCTYRRNELLERLLRNLAVQRTSEAFEYSAVVVDNDAEGHARETVARLQAELNFDITYSIEPEHTIPAARNHALRLAKGNLLGIIDDDEFPPVNWLLKMYEGLQTFASDGVLGPVFPLFTVGAPSWLIKSGIAESPVHRTGTLLHWSQTFTNNVLIKKEVFLKHNLMFDLRFRTGGSDQEFFRQAMIKGCQFRAVADAPVFEVLPPVRWSRKYWMKRALVNGFNAKRYRSAGFSNIRQTVKSALGTPIYILLLPISVCLGQHRLLLCLEKACYHFSRCCAAFGVELWKRRDF